MMGRTPAVIIVVRHGARLDAADKQWHLTSPTPYDPPLTYGGWTQSRALGARIASILRSRETDDEIPVTDDKEERNGKDKRKRRHKVIIHSSPFLRCVQTSVAISAGLAQNPGHIYLRPSSSSSTTAMKASQMHSSPKIRAQTLNGSPALTPIPEPASTLRGVPPSQEIRKSTMRIDAFLGEWLSPDYFELITPPPGSVMMVAGAKADLLRREDYSSLLQARETSTPFSSQPFPGGWGSPLVLAQKDKDDGPLDNLSSLGQALRGRDRGSSLSSVGSSSSRKSRRRSISVAVDGIPEHAAYQPPVPSYAISNSDPIPAGYVAHARDACVDVEYQWDSMREPQNCGNGGEYGEEWSAMHKRFRKGLQHLISWYQNTDDPGKVAGKGPLTSNLEVTASAGVDDDDTDLVMILVTHGAGCNALIGALTNQPVLLDVGMASLTMAVRKSTPVSTPMSTPGHSRAPSKSLSISDQYDVKLVANTEHLRPSTTSSPIDSRNSSGPALSAFRERFHANPGTFEVGGFGRSARASSSSSTLSHIRRTASIASSAPRNYATNRTSSVGLWSAPQVHDDAMSEPEDDMILNFGDQDTDKATAHVEAEAEAEEAVYADEEKEAASEEVKHKDEEDEVVAPLGLWGSPRPPGMAEKIREIAPKRRWTVSERG